MHVFFSGDGRDSALGQIVLIVVAVIVIVVIAVVVDNVIIAAATAEADELPFNFLTYPCTCICRV